VANNSTDCKAVLEVTAEYTYGLIHDKYLVSTYFMARFEKEPLFEYIIPADEPDLREYPHLWQGLANPEDWDGGPLRPYNGVGWTSLLRWVWGKIFAFWSNGRNRAQASSTMSSTVRRFFNALVHGESSVR
jgi:hypothetical protein